MGVGNGEFGTASSGEETFLELVGVELGGAVEAVEHGGAALDGGSLPEESCA